MSIAVQGSEPICAFRCGGVLYGVHAGSVCEVLPWRQPTPVPLVPPQVAGMIPYHGEILAVLRLSSILDLSAVSRNGAMLVLEDPSTAERFALAIDSVEQVLSMSRAQVELKPPSLTQHSQPFFSRTLTGPGEPVILLNVSSLTPDSLTNKLFTGSEPRVEGEPCAP